MNCVPMTSIMENRERYILWRKRNRIKQRHLANYCNCSIAAISLWENCHYINDELTEKYDQFIREFEAGKINLRY